jgi:hypothetical protein
MHAAHQIKSALFQMQNVHPILLTFVFCNFALGEVCTVANDEQQTHLQPIVVVIDQGIWPMDFMDNKNK